MSLYIIEGARNSGKTTAVKRLVSAYPEGVVSAIKFHRTVNPPLFMTEFLAKNYLGIIDSRSLVVLDRFHLTEFVMRTLDKKVPFDVLRSSTQMIDMMLKHCGAITYIVETSEGVRRERAKRRDHDHTVNEWRTYSELDATWKMAIKTFRKCKTKVMSGETAKDIDNIVIDIMKEQKDMGKLDDKIPFFAPKIEEMSMV